MVGDLRLEWMGSIFGLGWLCRYLEEYNKKCHILEKFASEIGENGWKWYNQINKIDMIKKND